MSFHRFIGWCCYQSYAVFIGFSEAEVKYRFVEPKSGKSAESLGKEKKRQVSLKLQEKHVEPLSCK